MRRLFAVLCAHVTTSSRLVVHVGLHKTSSKATQHVLVKHAKAIEGRWPRVKIAAAKSVYDGAFVPNTLAWNCRDDDNDFGGNKKLVNPVKLEWTSQEIRHGLAENRTVIVSFEDADRMKAACLKAFVQNMTSDARAVVVLRDPLDWLRSMWTQEACGKVRFFPWLFEQRIDATFAVPTLSYDRFTTAFPDVRVISYDNLGETSVAAYIVCNASLDLSSDWRECNDFLTSRTPIVHTTTKSSFACDTAPFAAALVHAAGCRRRRSISKAAINDLASRLPTTCRINISSSPYRTTSILTSLVEPIWDAWLKTLSHGPKNLPPSPIFFDNNRTHPPNCFLDDARLSQDHIRDILRTYGVGPHCDHTTYESDDPAAPGFYTTARSRL